MAAAAASPPISFVRLKQIANDACSAAVGSAEYYEHSKTESWNTTIINTILKALISESSNTSTPPAYKYAVNSTIIQHLVPTHTLSAQKSSMPTTSAAASTAAGAPSDDASLSSSSATAATPTRPNAVDTSGKPHVGRRGMHSATGAYWNDKTDGMWSFKYEGGEGKGLDVVISVIWVGI